METNAYEDALQAILGERTVLQQELVDKQAERKSLQLDIADKKVALKKARSRQGVLEHTLREKRIAHSKALDQESLDIANTALAEHKNDLDSCITLIKNLVEYLNSDSRHRSGVLLDEIKQIKIRLYKNHFDYLVTHFGSKRSDEDLQFMKDFIVINYLLKDTDYGRFRGFNLGTVFEEIDGTLEGQEYSEHEKAMLNRLECEGDE